AVPRLGAVVLEGDVAAPGVVLDGGPELVLRAVGAPARLGPLVGVDRGGGGAVDGDLHDGALASDLDLVPLAGGPGDVLRGGDEVVDGAEAVDARATRADLALEAGPGMRRGRTVVRLR